MHHQSIHTSYCRKIGLSSIYVRVSGLVMLLGDDYRLDNLQWHGQGDLAVELCDASRPCRGAWDPKFSKVQYIWAIIYVQDRKKLLQLCLNMFNYLVAGNLLTQRLAFGDSLPMKAWCKLEQQQPWRWMRGWPATRDIGKETEKTKHSQSRHSPKIITKRIQKGFPWFSVKSPFSGS